MANKPSIPKGTRDFGPGTMVQRNYIFEVIRSVFEQYGYQPLETPALETLETLLGKYGEEGDRLIFRILNSGDFTKKARLTEVIKEMPQEDTGAISKELAGLLCEKALRYDLTVPFARYVVQYRDQITFPFKRYQIQPVWRADRPQKGRYREFYQCDVDVVGSNSLLNEAELIRIIDQVFSQLRIPVQIKLNNRKILAGLAEVTGQAEHLTDITVAIDKLEKIGEEGVIHELSDRGIDPSAIDQLMPIITSGGDRFVVMEKLQHLLKNCPIGEMGIQEVSELFRILDYMDTGSPVEFDISLARGLNYYTGAIIEVKARDIAIGSICGGGRYDDLTGIFGMPDVSGVGISFGADRIYDVMLQTQVFPQRTKGMTELLFIHFDQKKVEYIIPLATQLREAGFRTEVYPDPVKIKKQMNYANQNQIPVVILVGDDEIQNNQVTIKNMVTGKQMNLPAESFTDQLRKWIK